MHNLKPVILTGKPCNPPGSVNSPAWTCPAGLVMSTDQSGRVARQIRALLAGGDYVDSGDCIALLEHAAELLESRP